VPASDPASAVFVEANSESDFDPGVDFLRVDRAAALRAAFLRLAVDVFRPAPFVRARAVFSARGFGRPFFTGLFREAGLFLAPPLRPRLLTALLVPEARFALARRPLLCPPDARFATPPPS
jgi:hypothetical protein